MTDWEDLYHRNQLKSFRVGELEFYINHHNIAFKGKKDKKVWVVKAHIGGKILTSIVQDSQNIQPASDWNSESENDSDREEHIIGSSSNSSELNDSRDKAADSQQEQEVDATIPESSTSRNGRRRKPVLWENYVP